MNEPRIVVVGGGFAGISATHHLLAGGASVTLIDAARTLGGRARSDTLDGTVIDTGAQLIASSFAHTLRLFGHSAARVPSGLERTAGRDAIVSGGDQVEIQFGSIRSLLAFRGLSAMEKLRLARHLLPLLALHRTHLSAMVERLPISLDNESAAGFIASHVGPHAAELLAETTTNSFYAAAGEETSLGFLLTIGRYASDADMLASRHGWSALLGRSVASADVVLAARVTSLAMAHTHVVVTATDGREWRADAVVLATDARSAGEILAGAGIDAPELIEWLATVPIRRTLTLALGVDVPLERKRFGIFRARREARVVSACAAHGAKLPDLTYGADVALAWPTPEFAPQLVEASSDEVVDAMLPEIEQLLPAVRGRITRARVYRFGEGTPLPHPGFAADRTRARLLVEALPPTIALAGDYLSAPIIEGAVLTGERAARRLRSTLANA